MPRIPHAVSWAVATLCHRRRYGGVGCPACVRMRHKPEEVPMATVVTPPTESIPMRPAFLDGRPKRMLINGQWVEAASGKTFDSINPSTGETLATIAEGDA